MGKKGSYVIFTFLASSAGFPPLLSSYSLAKLKLPILRVGSKRQMLDDHNRPD